MFEATCLGHHCWLFRAGDDALLVDPLFFDTFGFTPAVCLEVWPARDIDIAALPPLRAVFLTHEHEGHFDLRSLDRIDRRVPILVSARSSVAMRTILAEMGFDVRPTHPGAVIPLGRLRLLPMTADQVAHGIIEEWDVLPYLVWDADGHGSFFTQVDMRADARMIATAQAHVPRIAVWAHTDNHHQYWSCRSDGQPTDHDIQRRVRHILEIEEALARGWEPPELSLVAGGGWAFGGEQEWLNRNAFVHAPSDVVGALRFLLPGRTVAASRGGTTLRMVDGAVTLGEGTEFVRPREARPRGFVGDVPWLEDYRPATGRTELTDAEARELLDELAAFAAHLYGGPLFRRLYSHETGDPRGGLPTIALMLRVGDEGGAMVLAYDPTACAFVPVEETDPTERYLAVYECWATDLLATFRAEISQNAIGLGRFREWASDPTRELDLGAPLFGYAHPLRYPSRFLALYRHTLARDGGAEGPRVPMSDPRPM